MRKQLKGRKRRVRHFLPDGDDILVAKLDYLPNSPAEIPRIWLPKEVIQNSCLHIIIVSRKQ